jgi:hypothetical protein
VPPAFDDVTFVTTGTRSLITIALRVRCRHADVSRVFGNQGAARKIRRRRAQQAKESRRVAASFLFRIVSFVLNKLPF